MGIWSETGGDALSYVSQSYEGANELGECEAGGCPVESGVDGVVTPREKLACGS